MEFLAPKFNYNSSDSIALNECGTVALTLKGPGGGGRMASSSFSLFDKIGGASCGERVYGWV